MQIIATFHIPKEWLEERLKVTRISRKDFESRVKAKLLEAADNISAHAILVETKFTD